MLLNSGNNQLDKSIQTDLVQAFVAFRNKMQQFDYLNTEGATQLRTKLAEGLNLVLLSTIAPQRSDKYALNQNTLAHLQSTQGELFIQSNRQLVKKCLIEKSKELEIEGEIHKAIN